MTPESGIPAFGPGARVRVRADAHPGHHRTPLYLKGQRGVVVRHLCTSANPERLAYGEDGRPFVSIYQVRFMQRELWPGFTGPAGDTLVADILETWLIRAD